MGSGVIEVKLSIPCFNVRVRGKEYLIDAYFIKYVSFPPRRSLLIFPPKGFKKDIIPNTKVVSGISDVREIINYLLDTYEYSVRNRLSEAVNTLRKFRTSLLIPTNWFRMKVKDEELRECVGALYILEGVFKKDELIRGSIVFDSWSRVFIPITVKALDNNVDKVSFYSPNERICKAYKWLASNDKGFREALSKLIGINLIKEEFMELDLRKLLKL